MPPIAQRIKHARLMRGLSLQDLSDHMDNKISRQALHKYEKGKVVPDNVMVQELADALDLKPDYFYRDHAVEIKEVAFRKLSKLSKKEQNRIIETARDFLERYLELEQIIGKQPKVENPLIDISIDKKEDVEQAAQQLRHAWDLGTDPLYNVLELLEDQGIKIVELEGDESIDGFSTWINDAIPVIGLNSNRREHLDRYRFTALHELGHLLLNLESFKSNEQEKLCHHFAGALLLDKRAIESEIGLKRSHISLQELKSLKKQYGISMQAIMYRFKELGIISQAVMAEFFKFINSQGMKKDESDIATYEGEEVTLRFDQLLGQALAEEYITISKAAALKNLRVSEFRKSFLLG
ncbi:MAG: XRE family transcriptional regulator [Balneolaceae bacterium]|nr:XRE family transcriptional regulator [Balneolaceae bacterium]